MPIFGGVDKAAAHHPATWPRSLTIEAPSVRSVESAIGRRGVREGYESAEDSGLCHGRAHPKAVNSRNQQAWVPEEAKPPATAFG